jgi:hypothetical protein
MSFAQRPTVTRSISTIHNPDIFIRPSLELFITCCAGYPFRIIYAFGGERVILYSYVNTYAPLILMQVYDASHQRHREWRDGTVSFLRISFLFYLLLLLLLDSK